MTNILLEEYQAKLSQAAAIHGAIGGAKLDRNQARWEARVGDHVTCSVSIQLRPDPNNYECLVPHASIGGSSCFTSDILEALTDLEARRVYLHKCLDAFAHVRYFRVWVADCPCDWCSQTGKIRGVDCESCKGTGKRQKAKLFVPIEVK